MDNRDACPGCGASFAASDGPTHRYLGASAGCWAVFGEILAREYSDARYFAVHHLTVDAYCAQHPGDSSRRAVQSAGVHLIALYMAIELGRDAAELAKARGQAVKTGAFVHLAPPSQYAMTVIDVRAADSPEMHGRLVRAWAEEVWQRWQPHHTTIRAWANNLPRGGSPSNTAAGSAS